MHNKRPTRVSYVDLVLFILVSLICSGCSLGLLTIESALDRIPHTDRHRNWILAKLETTAGDRLISIATNPEWQSVRVRDRWIADGVVICEEHVTGHPSKRIYEICDPEAVAMFRSLYHQASEGYAYRSKSWGWRHSSNPYGDYLLTTGPRTTLTISEGGKGKAIISQVERWRTALMLDESIPDAEIAPSLYDRDAFASPAIYVILAVGYFDDLCRVASLVPEEGHGEK